MSIIDSMMNKFGISSKDDEFDEELMEPLADEPVNAEPQEAPIMDKTTDSSKVVDFQSAQSAREKESVVSYKMKVIVIEPKTFDDAQQVANNLREKKPVVINFEKTDTADAKRIIDFISGTTYALNGEIKKVGHNVFLCAPSNVNVSYTEEERKVSAEMPWLRNDKTDK